MLGKVWTLWVCNDDGLLGSRGALAFRHRSGRQYSLSRSHLERGGCAAMTQSALFEGEKALEKLGGIFTIRRHWNSKGRGKRWKGGKRNKWAPCPGRYGEWAGTLQGAEESGRPAEYFKLLMLNEQTFQIQNLSNPCWLEMSRLRLKCSTMLRLKCGKGAIWWGNPKANV